MLLHAARVWQVALSCISQWRPRPPKSDRAGRTWRKFTERVAIAILPGENRPNRAGIGRVGSARLGTVLLLARERDFLMELIASLFDLRRLLRILDFYVFKRMVDILSRKQWNYVGSIGTFLECTNTTKVAYLFKSNRVSKNSHRKCFLFKKR